MFTTQTIISRWWSRLIGNSVLWKITLPITVSEKLYSRCMKYGNMPNDKAGSRDIVYTRPLLLTIQIKILCNGFVPNDVTNM